MRCLDVECGFCVVEFINWNLFARIELSLCVGWDVGHKLINTVLFHIERPAKYSCKKYYTNETIAMDLFIWQLFNMGHPCPSWAYILCV